MKNLNLLKLFILLTTVISSFSVSAQEYGSGAQKIDGVWYSTTLHTNGTQYAFVRDEWNWTSENIFDLNLQYPSTKIKFDLKNQTGVTSGQLSQKNITMSISQHINNSWQAASYTTGQLKTSVQTFETSLEQSATAVRFTRNRGNLSCYLTNIYVTMAHHIKMASATTNNYGEVEIEDSKPFTVDFHSFLSKGELTATTSDPDVFRINGTKDKEVKIADANECEKVNQGNYNFTINFVPQAAVEYYGTVTISDGTNTITITLSGIGTKKEPTITWVTNKTIAEEEELENAATSNCGTGITFSSADERIIKIVDNKLIGVSAGSVEITATTNGDTKWESKSSTETFIVTAKTVQNIVWEQYFYLLKLGDEPITLNAYSTDKKTGNANGREITYSSANENVVKIENGALHIVGIGNTTIKAVQEGDANTYAYAEAIKTVVVREVSDNCNGTYAFIGENKTVQQGTVTYTFDKPGKSFSINASINSNVRLTITDDLGNTLHQEDYDEKSATLSNITLDPKARMLMFNIYGLDTWFGAPQANTKDVTFSNLLIEQAQYITPQAENVSITPTEFGKSSSTTFNVSYSGQPDVILATLKDGKYFSMENSVINETGLCSNAATESFSVKFTPDSAGAFNDVLVITCKDYSKEIPVTASGIGRNQIIEWEQDLNELTLNSEPITLNASSSEGLTVYYESSNTNVATVSGHTLTIVGAGEATITAKQDGDKAHLAATPVSKTITIAKLDQTITWEQEFAADLTIGNTIELNATATSGEAVVFASSNEAVATIADNVLTVTGVGETTITASQAGNNNYNAATEVTKTLSIGKLDQTITWNQDIANLQIGESVTLDATASSGLEIVYTSNNDSVASIDGTTLTVNSEGSVVITATQAGDETYKSASLERTFSFGRMAQTITWNDDLTNLVINDTVILTATSDAELAIVYTVDNNTVATINGDTLFIIGAGEAIITASQAGNETYNSTSVSKTITIAKLDQTITWEQEFAADLTIGNTIELNATATSGEAVVFASSNEAVATIADNVLTVTGVGETTITASQAGNNNYNAATEVTKTLSIGKLDQTITWNQDIANLQIGESVTLDATASSGLEIVYTSNNDSVASIDGTTLTVNSEGSVVITATQAGDETYKSASLERTFSFGRMAQTITWNDDLTNLVINDTVILTATSDAELAIVYTVDNNTVATINGDTLFIIGAGEAIITASQAGNETYNSTSVSKTINIAKLGQAIEWNQELDSLTIENEAIELTATATSGLSITYTSSDETVAVVNGNILTIVGLGSATITASQEGDNTYNEAESVEKTITITKQTQEIIWEQTFEDLDIEDYPYELTAYATSGLEIIYELDNDSEGEKAMIEGNYLYPFQGNCYITIYAYQEGNEMYEAAKYVEKTVYISSSTLNPTHIENTTTTLIYVDNTIYFNGKHNTLSVYDMTGRQIYSAKVTGENQHYLPLTQNGIYVVCLDNETLKIVK